MVTVYDYQMAKIVDESDCEMILVGDSLGMIVQGLDGTTHVNIEDMEYHLKCVRRGAPNTFIVLICPLRPIRLARKRPLEMLEN